MNELTFRTLSIDLIDEIYHLESISYPEDEAASLQNIKLRLTNASNLFLGAFLKDQLIGFVNGTKTSSTTLTHESMSTHEPNGETLCIHSVVIDPKYRRKGYGTLLTKKYIEHVKGENTLKRIRLLAKKNLIEFYKACGFDFYGNILFYFFNKFKGESSVVHGKEKWYDLGMSL